jgi:exonuclease III
MFSLPAEAGEGGAAGGTSSPWKKSSRTFSRNENLRFSRVLRTRDRIPAIEQAVYPRPASRHPGIGGSMGLVAVVLLANVAGGADSEPDTGPSRCRLRIASFNAENLAAPGERTGLTRFRFETGRRRHIERVAAVVETLAPDILVMPEVVSRAGVDAVVEILHEKGLGTYRGYHVDGRDAFSRFDVAIIARIPPDQVDGAEIRIRAPDRKTGRGTSRAAGEEAESGGDADWLRRRYSFVDEKGATREDETVLERHALAFFTVCGTRLGILGLHLKSNPSDAASNAQRGAEVAIAREIVRRDILARGYVPVVLGDLNDYDPDVPMADASRRTRTTVLRDLKDIDPATAGPELVNAARFIPRVADRYSSHWDVNENGAPDGDDVFTLLDHVLLHRDLEPAIRRVFICHATDLDVSDHFPVVVDLEFGNPAGGPPAVGRP